MQIGIRLHDTKKGTLEERVAIAEEQGFSCAHLALKKVISEYSVADSALTPGFSCYLKNLFAAHHLDIAVLGCYLNLATLDQAVLEKNVHRYMAHIRMASLIGAGVVGTETGAVNESYSFEERNHSEEALDIFIKNVRPVVQYAEKMGVILAIEPVYKHILSGKTKLLYVALRICRLFLIQSIFWTSVITKSANPLSRRRLRCLERISQ